MDYGSGRRSENDSGNKDDNGDDCKQERKDETEIFHSGSNLREGGILHRQWPADSWS